METQYHTEKANGPGALGRTRLDNWEVFAPLPWGIDKKSIAAQIFFKGGVKVDGILSKGRGSTDNGSFENFHSTEGAGR